jgi:hypothetical protein
MSSLQAVVGGDTKHISPGHVVDPYTLGAPITIGRILRRMRGGSQAQMVQGANGHFFVAKFAGHPQGSRTLINELIAYQVIRQFNVLTPQLSLLHLPEDLAGDKDLYFQVGSRRTRPQGSVHLGSRCPVNPEKTAIFDFLPDRLLPKVSNLEDFATMFVIDKWLHQTDKRQSIFIRDKKAADIRFLAYFVDHGSIFDGGNWRLGDEPLHGLAFTRRIYSLIDMRTLVQNVLCRVENISESILMATPDVIPSAWFAPGDRECLATLLIQLRERQPRLPLLVSRHLDHLDL